MSLITKLNRTLEAFLPPLLSTEVWQRQYSLPLPLISIGGLVPPPQGEPQCRAPALRALRALRARLGRPRKERPHGQRLRAADTGGRKGSRHAPGACLPELWHRWL
jgi:hypothetical protein